MTEVLTAATLIPRTEPTFYFVGVTTGQSSIMKVFPRWMTLLDRELDMDTAAIVGIDVPLGAPANDYRRIVEHIKGDPLVVGGLVTAHKLDLLSAARDLFDQLDDYAARLGEVSAISKREGALHGHAKDPISSGLAIEAFIPRGAWVSGGEVLCFGCGGAAVATTIYLAGREDRPARVTLTDISESRLDHAREIHQTIQTNIEFAYVLNNDPTRNDTLMESLPPGSLVINATGMGKDRPGSPITDSALFPQHGFAWDFNYRGDLNFLHQARRQSGRGLHVEDGWVYFLHGWTQVIAEVFHIHLSPELFAKLDSAAR